MYVGVARVYMHVGMRVHVGGQRLSFSMASSPFIYLFLLRQDFSLSLEFTSSARLVGQQSPGICSSLPPLCWDCRGGRPRMTYTGAGHSEHGCSRLPSPAFSPASCSWCVPGDSRAVRFLALDGAVHEGVRKTSALDRSQEAKKHKQALQMCCQRRSVGRSF